jgi:hypothetical protein
MKKDAEEYQVRFEQQSLIIKEGHKQIKLQQNDIIYLRSHAGLYKSSNPATKLSYTNQFNIVPGKNGRGYIH